MALKVGIVGLRGIGNQHADCHAKDPLADLVAVCDIVKERAEETAKKHGVRAYTTLAEMLRNEDLDIVDVTTGGYENGSWHYEPAMEAMAAGKHVLVEKPISNQVTEAREMVATAAQKGVYLGCNLNHFFTPPAEKADDYMKQGHVGELVYCLHKMGFSGGEGSYGPNNSSRF
ncbi:MAG TPA: Gfo/Idh/MocA family oxidoreductase, partial [Armatimonadota bacterium]